MTRTVSVLALLLVALAPIVVAANVPDPTWIAGVYDGADGDEMLALLWDQTPAVATAPVRLELRAEPLFEVVPIAVSAPTIAAPATASRAPPRV
jgi:hypothetical protein